MLAIRCNARCASCINAVRHFSVAHIQYLKQHYLSTRPRRLPASTMPGTSVPLSIHSGLCDHPSHTEWPFGYPRVSRLLVRLANCTYPPLDLPAERRRQGHGAPLTANTNGDSSHRFSRLGSILLCLNRVWTISRSPARAAIPRAVSCAVNVPWLILSRCPCCTNSLTASKWPPTAAWHRGGFIKIPPVLISTPL